MRQGASSQMKHTTQQQLGMQQQSLNMSQANASVSQIQGQKRNQLNSNQNQNQSFHHQPLSTNESGIMSQSKQPSQKTNSQKTHHSNHPAPSGPNQISQNNNSMIPKSIVPQATNKSRNELKQVRSLQDQAKAQSKQHDLEIHNSNLNSTQGAAAFSSKGLKLAHANQDLGRNHKALKGQFYNTGSGGAVQTNSRNLNQSRPVMNSSKNVMLSSQPQTAQSINQSVNYQLQFQTPTSVHQKRMQNKAPINPQDFNKQKISSKQIQLMQKQEQNQSYLYMDGNQNNQKYKHTIASRTSHQKSKATEPAQIQDKKRKRKAKQRMYDVTIRILEGKIVHEGATNQSSISSLFSSFQTYVTVEFEGKHVHKTSALPGKNPKWNEYFQVQANEIGGTVKIDLFSKFLIQKDEKLGSVVFYLDGIDNYTSTHWYVLCDEDDKTVASVFVHLYGEEIESKTPMAGKELEKIEVSDAEFQQQDQSSEEEEDGEQEDDVGDDDSERSIDLRDQEISRSMVPRSQIRNVNERSFARSGTGVALANSSAQGAYKALHTQQQHQSSHSYLHNQLGNAAVRQSVTENSVIRHYSSHSSDDDAGGLIELDSPSKVARPHSHYQSGAQNKKGAQQNINTKNGIKQHHQHKYIDKNLQGQQYMQDFQHENDQSEEEQILPQQLFYSKNQTHQNSSNNLHMNQQMYYQQQHNFVTPHQQQYMFMDPLSGSQDISQGQISNYLNQNQIKHGGHHKNCKKSKEKDGRRAKIHNQERNRDFENYEVNRLNSEGQEHYEEEDSNYANYIIHRSQLPINKTISNSNSQQYLSAFPKHQHQNYDSGGASSGGQQQIYHLTNMGLSGSGGDGVSYLPQGVAHNVGPSYFEDQNSLESLNIGAGLHMGGLSGGSNNHNGQIIGLVNSQGQYVQNRLLDISELQDIEQTRALLLEENSRINKQEQQIRQLLASYNIKKSDLHNQQLLIENAKADLLRQEEQFQSLQKQATLQSKEFKYQKQQLERRFLNMKRERLLISQKQKQMEELLDQAGSLLQLSQAFKELKQANPQKAEEIMNLMRQINYNLKVLNTSDKFQELDRLMQEELIYQQQQQMLKHIQQDSTSSQANSSNGFNYMFQNGVNKDAKNLSPRLQAKQLKNQGIKQLGSKDEESMLRNKRHLENIKIREQNPRRQSSNHSHMDLSHNNSQLSPKVITDLINTDEIDFLDQEELFKKIGPHIADQDEDFERSSLPLASEYPSTQANFDFQSKGYQESSASNRSRVQEQSKEQDKKNNQYFFNKSSKAQYLNEQHELSTIIEKDQLTSQRRSSNGGGQQMLGAQGTFDNSANNFTANNFNPNTNASYQSKRIKNIEEEKQTNELAEKLAKFDELQKAMEEKLQNISKYEEYLKKMKEDQENQIQSLGTVQQMTNNTHSVGQNQMLQNMMNEVNLQSSSEDIVHITASQAPTNPNTSLMNQSYSQMGQNNQYLYQQSAPYQFQAHAQMIQEPNFYPQSNHNLQSQIIQQQQQEQSQAPQQDPEESMEFVVDPDFLSKINQNMRSNDGKFGQNNNQPPIKSVQPQLVNLNINPLMFYNGIAAAEDDEDEDENNQQQLISAPSAINGQVVSQNIPLQNNFMNQTNFQNLDYSQAQNQQNLQMLLLSQQNMQPMSFQNPLAHNQNGISNLTQGSDFDQLQQNLMLFMQNQQQFSQQPMYLQQAEGINFTQNQPEMQRDSSALYGNFNDMLEQDNQNDFLQKYDCGGTILHVNNNQQNNQLPPQPVEVDSTKPTKKEKLPDDEIIRLINEKYQFEESNKDVSVIYSQDGKVFDQPKKAVYGIQPWNVKF